MSESAPEKTGGGGNVFTRKIGPLSLWVWMLIALVVAIVFYVVKKKGSSSTGSTDAGNNIAAGSADSSLVPQFVNQTYVNNSPPAQSSAPTGTSTTSSTSPLNEILTAGHVINPSAGKAEIGWTISQKSPNATQLKVVLNGPGAKNQTRYIPASATTATFDDLQKGHTYVADITPIDSAGQAVGGPNHVTFVTSKT